MNVTFWLEGHDQPCTCGGILYHNAVFTQAQPDGTTLDVKLEEWPNGLLKVFSRGSSKFVLPSKFGIIHVMHCVFSSSDGVRFRVSA